MQTAANPLLFTQETLKHVWDELLSDETFLKALYIKPERKLIVPSRQNPPHNDNGSETGDIDNPTPLAKSQEWTPIDAVDDEKKAAAKLHAHFFPDEGNWENEHPYFTNRNGQISHPMNQIHTWLQTGIINGKSNKNYIIGSVAKELSFLKPGKNKTTFSAWLNDVANKDVRIFLRSYTDWSKFLQKTNEDKGEDAGAGAGGAAPADAGTVAPADGGGKQKQNKIVLSNEERDIFISVIDNTGLYGSLTEKQKQTYDIWKQADPTGFIPSDFQFASKPRSEILQKNSDNEDVKRFVNWMRSNHSPWFDKFKNYEGFSDTFGITEDDVGAEQGINANVQPQRITRSQSGATGNGNAGGGVSSKLQS